MDSRLKSFLAGKTHDQLPAIASLREVRSTNELVQKLATSEWVSTNERTERAFTIAPYYLPWDVELKDSLLFPDAGLLKITNFYYRDLDTWFGTKPFEYFVLNKTYREYNSCCYGANNVNRMEEFRMWSKWLPFLDALVIDTCNYIMTGQRDINIHVLYELSCGWAFQMRDGQEPVFPELNVQPRFKWSEIENLTSEEFFRKWVGRKHGIQDLICSYKVMLGL